MRVLVTGGAGFIGSNVSEALLHHGHDVVIYDDFSTGRHANLDNHAPAQLVEASILDKSALERAMEGVHQVVHLAARPSVSRSVEDPVATNTVNVEGTLNVLLAARAAGVRRVVQASSSSVYGDARRLLPDGSVDLLKRERQRPAPMSPYAVSKLAAEQYGVAFTKSMGLDVVALRFFNVFGKRQNPAGAYSAVIPRFIDHALRGRPVTVYGDGLQSRDFCHVSNVVDAVRRCLQAPANLVAGRVFNVACGERTTVLDMIGQLGVLAGTDLDVIHTGERSGDIVHSLADISDIGEATHYSPLVRFPEGLRRTWEWFLQRLEASP